jgi:hypothetical protein
VSTGLRAGARRGLLVLGRRVGGVALFSWNALSMDVVVERDENVAHRGEGGGRGERQVGRRGT